ncbi:hypothetical protein IF2G_02707 [Cordyceps javanica]|nr:hypothetical protein IF2G_02707 [Cordyceps javanica]
MRDTYSSPEGSSSEKQWDPWNLYSTDGHEGAVFDDTYGTYGTCSSTESRDGKDQWGPWNPYSRTAGSGAASDGTFNASPSTSTAPSFSPSKGKISSTLPAGVRANNSSACKPSPAGISTAPAPHSTSEDGSSTRRSYTSSTEPLKFDDWDANSPFDVSGSAAAVAAREAQVKQAEALAWQILYSGEKSEDDYWKKIRGSGSGEKV